MQDFRSHRHVQVAVLFLLGTPCSRRRRQVSDCIDRIDTGTGESLRKMLESTCSHASVRNPASISHGTAVLELVLVPVSGLVMARTNSTQTTRLLLLLYLTTVTPMLSN